MLLLIDELHQATGTTKPDWVPPPPEIVDEIDDYLSQISNNNKMHPAMRVKAATELGSMAGIRTAGRISMALQLHFAFEDALEEYSRRFPPRDEADAL